MIEHALTRYRKARGLSLYALGELVGTSAATLSRLECRLQDPSFRLVRRIIAATDGEVTAEDFVAPPDLPEGA